MRACWAAAASAALLLLLAACATTPRYSPTRAPRPPPTELPAHPPDISLIPDVVPHWEPRSALGNPPFYDVDGHRYFVLASASGYVERGIASWYGPQFHGLHTATGEPYDMFAMTAAHKSLPLPCYARVTNLDNGRSVVVRINDRGPFVANRIIDLSYSAAVKLGMIRTGTAFVQVQTLAPAPPNEPVPVSLPATVPAAGAAIAGVSSVPAMPVGTPIAAPPIAAPPIAAAPIAAPTARAPTPLLEPNSSQTLSPPAPFMPRAADHSPLFIQVGAFARLDNARRAAQRLRDAGLQQVFVLAAQPRQPLLRVRIGPIDTAQQFDALMGRLQALGFAGARLAQD